jgi:NAD(P)-dependent dehydrogenase (short-subunit alcohol dehydrogenase family)
MDLGLTNKVAIITGGSEGIGKAAAQRMANEGAQVVIVARRANVLEEAAQAMRATLNGPGGVLPLPGDVSEAATIDRVVQTTIENFGRIDILVNNAGVSMAKPFEEVSEDDWESDFNLKVWSAVRLIRAVIPEMRKVGGGRIINVTNLGGRTPGPSSMPTSISRAAGMAITKGLSKDLAQDNILVNTVCIGLIKSGQHERRYAALKETQPDLTMESFYADRAKARGVPLGRVGEAHEAGDVITFLASERASYLTGVAINIDGGNSAVL